eukprot:scaffold66754_cov14-Tisochrysis_lutea.AAC.1
MHNLRADLYSVFAPGLKSNQILQDVGVPWFVALHETNALPREGRQTRCRGHLISPVRLTLDFA